MFPPFENRKEPALSAVEGVGQPQLGDAGMERVGQPSTPHEFAPRTPPPLRMTIQKNSHPSRWPECVFTINHTGRPGDSCSESRAAKVRCTDISAPQSTLATTIMSLCQSDSSLAGKILRALSPTGADVAS